MRVRRGDQEGLTLGGFLHLPPFRHVEDEGGLLRDDLLHSDGRRCGPSALACLGDAGARERRRDQDYDGDTQRAARICLSVHGLPPFGIIAEDYPSSAHFT